MASMEEIITSARQKLVTSVSLASLLGVDIGQDPPGGAFSDGWVFLGHDDYNAPERDVQNTGKAAVVLSMRRPWGSPNLHNNQRFRRLNFTIVADMSRGVDNTLTYRKDAEYRLDRIATAIASEFHDAINDDHNWPNGVFIGSCLLYNDFVISDVLNQDGLISGDMDFALELV